MIVIAYLWCQSAKTVPALLCNPEIKALERTRNYVRGQARKREECGEGDTSKYFVLVFTHSTPPGLRFVLAFKSFPISSVRSISFFSLSTTLFFPSPSISFLVLVLLHLGQGVNKDKLTRPSAHTHPHHSPAPTPPPMRCHRGYEEVDMGVFLFFFT